MITFDEALARLLASASRVGAERVALDGAAGRVAADDVIAGIALPPFDYSSMDGYAVRASDVPREATVLPVVGETAAGAEAGELVSGTARRIFTGAPIPRGADAVIMQEEVTREGDRATMAKPPKVGQFIRRRGEDLAEGAVAIKAGTRLSPGHVALAAALDRPELAVARRPVVTILCTGDELRAPAEPGKPGSIAESNGYFVRATAERAGAIARVAPFVKDDAAIARRAVEDALRGSDLVVTIGGVSVGDHDVMKAALQEASVTLDFWKVRIKPGKPLAIGRAAHVHVVGLPGNPASASLTFLLFGVPLLRAMQGDTAPLPARTPLPIAGKVRREAGRMEFLRCRLEPGASGSLVARADPNQASGAVTSFARADSLAVVPADRERVDEGDILDVIRIAEM